MSLNRLSLFSLIICALTVAGCSRSNDAELAKAKAEAEAAKAKAEAELAKVELEKLKDQMAKIPDKSADKSESNPHHMFLLTPKVTGLEAEINGAVDSTANVQRIIWNWGDATPESESWFPAKHRFAKEGTYQVRVTSFDAPGNTSTHTTTVTVSGVTKMPAPQPGAKSPTAQNAPSTEASAANVPATPPPGPLVVDRPLTRPGVLRTLNVAFGQYGGRPKLEPGTGVKFADGHTAPAIWAKEYLGPKYRAEFEMKLGNESAWAVCVLNGPGHGNSFETGYGCRINHRNVTLLRDGKSHETVERPHADTDWAQVQANVDSGNVEVILNGVPVATIEDPEPLSGPRNGWFGLIGGGGVTFRNLKIWSPETNAKRERQLTPPVTEQPAQNGELLYELKLSGGELGSEWHKSQPQNTSVKNGALVLQGPNGVPDVILTKPLPPELACDVEFEYPEDEAVNFSLMLLSAKQVPSSSKEYTGWLVGLPGGDGRSTIRWQSGPKDSGDGTWTQAPILAATGYYAPIAQRKYKVRLETHGRELRVFLDGGLLLKGQRPVESPMASTLFGMRQIYGGSKVHAVRIFKIAI